MRIYRMQNPVQRYSWGSPYGLRDALGIPNPDGGPVAEVWMGAHPKAPSMVIEDGALRRLDELIQESPEAFLGNRVLSRFGRALPFLLKGLSAAGPLSVQAHPAKRKAERGYDRENLAGIPIDAPERNYRDRNHKPEMVVALTPFKGLFGFRPIDAIIENIHLLTPDNWRRYAGKLEKNPGRVELSVLFYTTMTGDAAWRAETLAKTAVRVRSLLASGGLPAERVEALEWTDRLLQLYPGDMGALAPIALNLVTLRPGETLYVAPGELHAYFQGEALELMANSDNVIRGGLTGKHVDLPELISVLSFDSVPVSPRRASPVGPGEEAYPVFAPDFRLSRVAARDAGLELPVSGPEILLCVEGSGEVADAEGSVPITRGETVFVRADAGRFTISGDCVAYRAAVPQEGSDA
jgi:mannose-6-phosphate isomerase